MEDQEEWKDTEKHDGQINQDRFTSLMFGPRKEPTLRNHHTRQEPTHHQSTINYEELLMNIDTLVESVRGLKPLFHKVYPFIEQFWKKK